MKKLLKKIIGLIVNFFNRMVDQEAEGVIKMYRQISEVKPNE